MIDIVVDKISMQFDLDSESSLRVLDSLSFKVVGAKATALVGPSGCGKTTLLRILAGLLTPTEGTVTVVPENTHRVVGYMPQSDSLLPWRTAISNVQLGMELMGISRKEVRSRAKEMMAVVELSDFDVQLPRELSGGMKRRVELARTLALRPTLLFLDEPLAHLDLVSRRKIAGTMRNYILQNSSTAVIVTHSAEEAAIIADHIIVLKGRPARIADEFKSEKAGGGEGDRRLPEAEVFARIMAVLT